MRVILSEDIPSLGSIGDVVTVKDGFARNYLLPRSKAMLASDSNQKMLDHQKRVLEKKKAAQVADAKSLASKIEKVSVTVAKQVGEDEKIFGSVTTAEIEALLIEEGIQISRKQIKLTEEVKKVGVYTAEVRLHTDVNANLKVWVVAE